MTQQPPPMTPHRVIAQRVRQLRNGRGWSAQRLAEEMTRIGISWDRNIVANLETGRRNTVSVEEMFALAFVLNVAPVHLMVPPVDADDRTPYTVVPDSPVKGRMPWPEIVRAWIRGQIDITGDAKRYYTEVPESEWQPPAAAMNKAWWGEHGQR